MTDEWVANEPGERLTQIVVNEHEPDDMPFDVDWRKIREAYFAEERAAVKEVHDHGGVLVTGIRGCISVINEYLIQAKEDGMMFVHVDTLRSALEWSEQIDMGQEKLATRLAYGVSKRDIRDAIEEFDRWVELTEIEQMEQD